MTRTASPRPARLALAALAGLALAACGDQPLSTAVSPDGAAPRPSAFDSAVESPVAATSDLEAQPAFSGSRVAYLSVRGGNHDIYVHDLATGLERRVTSGTNMQQFPGISGEWVVYQDVGSSVEVRAHHLGTGADFQLSPAGYADVEPAVSGTRVVYSSSRHATGTVFMYDLSARAEVPVRTFPAGTVSPPSASEAEIGGDLVVWREIGGSPRTESIMVRDLSTGTLREAARSAALLANPATDGVRVVYEDYRHGNYEIYLFDTATGTERRITNHPGEQRNPRVSGNLVVWEDHRHGQGNAEIYAFDLAAGTEHRVTSVRGNQFRPVIVGSRIVWQDGRSYYDADVYMLTLAGS